MARELYGQGTVWPGNCMAREEKLRRRPPPSHDNADFSPHLPKRVKIDVDSPPHSPGRTLDQDDILEESDAGLAQSTPLESALPPLKNDKDAIAHYAAYTPGHSSIYVDAFNLALDTVLSEEQHLFTLPELNLFEEWKALDYEAQYLYVRLFLRKTRKWFRIKDLQYHNDIADIDKPVQTLQQPRSLPPVDQQCQQPPLYPSHLDLALELQPSAKDTSNLADTFCFAECSSQHINTLHEASRLLLLDELKVLAKDAKVQGKNKKELLHNLCQTSGQQTGLTFAPAPYSKAEHSSDRGLSLANRDSHYTSKILEQTGRCIRLSLPPLRLFERVHLVFYRHTEWTEKSLTTLILAKMARRNFPQYLVSRSSAIFQSREQLLEFEASLRTQFLVDNLLEFNGTPAKQQYAHLVQIVQAIYPRWKALLAEEQGKEERQVYDSGEGAYLRRFNPAWVYTRIMHKGLNALVRFKYYKREHQLLTELLHQRLFHHARRGVWYQRKALLEEHYMHSLTPGQDRSDPEADDNDGNSTATVDATVTTATAAAENDDDNDVREKKHWKRVALRTCEQGLEDPHCHIIYHFDLQKRIRKLERQLRIPLRDKHDFGHVRLAHPIERTILGSKIERDHSPGGRAFGKDKDAAAASHGARTVWLDELDTLGRVSVECMCLSHYRKVLGWKGYHSEGSILRVLFGLLFYDVLFAYVPNVFQTAYQTCPLDLHTDAFYPARISEINAVINRINNGQAETIINQVWHHHYPHKTSIVGVRWDDYELVDLVEIAQCFPPDALGTVMRVMAQEYAARGAGVPDLFLWKPGPGPDHDDDIANTGTSRGRVMFVEVKSANDRLSDTQRLWVSLLLGAGIPVELCHALAKDNSSR